MSQKFSLLNYSLITKRKDIIFYFGKTFDVPSNINILENLSDIKEECNSLFIVDGSLFEYCNTKEINRLLSKTFPIVIISPLSISEKLKNFIESNFDYVIPFPLEIDLFKDTLENFILDIGKEHKSLMPNNNFELTKKTSFSGFFEGSSFLAKKLRTEIEAASKNDSNVLLLGETGTGKSSCARTIHKLSIRGEKEMPECSIPGLVDGLAVSTFYGTKQGAFTDAKEMKGLLSQANNSSLFLDEIGLATEKVQSILLNVFELDKKQTLGSDNTERINVRFFSATNEDIVQLAKIGAFREDLLFRINDITIELPALRNRKEDISAIVHRFLMKENREISDSAINKLMEYDWPGNLRQLKKCIIRACNSTNKEIILADDIILSLYNF